MRDVVLAHNRPGKQMLVFFDKKSLTSKSFKLQKTSRKSIKAAVCAKRGGLVGFSISTARAMNCNTLSRILYDELGYDDKMVEMSLNVLINARFSLHQLSDTIH
jgi:hypothetical protein